MEKTFPILDISYLSENFQNSDKWQGDESFKNDQTIKNLVKELGTGFGTWGFLYVKGHQIPDELIHKAFKTSKEFFERPTEFKMKYRRGAGISEGYLPPNGETFDKNKPEDLKEIVDFVPNSKLCTEMANEIPDNVDALTNLFNHCKDVLFKLLRLLALALNVDTEYFVKLHSAIGKRENNGTSLRTLYYPALKNTISKEHRRCREHTDYGTITMLFQDEVGGLEVKSPSGEFIKALPISGTIVINAGDLLHTWSDGKFLATKHRVTIPNDPNRLGISRQSIALFTHPNYDVSIEYTDENGNVHMRKAFDHLNKRFNETIVVK